MSTRIPPEIAIELTDLTRLEHLVNDFNLLPKQAVHSALSGKHTSKLRGRGLDFSEVRKYVHGDDIRNIDWKVTARTKVTHTKVFNEEKERPAFLIVDQSSSMFFASQGTVKSVLAAKLAAIAGFKVLKSGDRIGGIVFDDENIENIKPKRSRKSLMYLLEEVVKKNQGLTQRKHIPEKQNTINKVLFQAKNMITHDYVVVLISDFQHLEDHSHEYLSNISRHNDIIAIMINDPMEFEFPNGKIPIGDGTHQLMMDGKEKTKSEYGKESLGLRERNLEFFKKHQIPVMEINTAEDLTSQIKNIFGRN